MKLLFILSFCILIPLASFTQDNVLKANRWSEWKADTARTQAGTINVTMKRIKITSDKCLITEEVIFFHDACNQVIGKTKIRSDCRRNLGEGNIIYEKRYKSKCDKK